MGVLSAETAVTEKSGSKFKKIKNSFLNLFSSRKTKTKTKKILKASLKL